MILKIQFKRNKTDEIIGTFDFDNNDCVWKFSKDTTVKLRFIEKRKIKKVIKELNIKYESENEALKYYMESRKR